MIAAALASAALALAGPAPATLQGDLDAAAAYWQQSTPAGCSTVALSYAQLPNRVLGEATVADTGRSEPCVMTIRPGLTRRLRCMTVVHEYGHWLGLHHTRNDLNPMFPVVDRGPVVPQCERP